MRTFETALRAAKYHARQNGESDKLGTASEEHAYIKKLIASETIIPVEDKRGNIRKWNLFEGNEWFIFDKDGNIMSAAHETKKGAMRTAGANTSTRVDTGIYEIENEDLYVARYKTFYKWWDGTDLA